MDIFLQTFWVMLKTIATSYFFRLRLFALLFGCITLTHTMPAFSNQCSTLFSEVKKRSNSNLTQVVRDLIQMGFKKKVAQKIEERYPNLAQELSSYIQGAIPRWVGQQSIYYRKLYYRKSLDNLSPVTLYRGVFSTMEHLEWDFKNQKNLLYSSDFIETAMSFGSNSRSDVSPPQGSYPIIIEMQVPRHIVHSSKGFQVIVLTEFQDIRPFVIRVGRVRPDESIDWYPNNAESGH